MPIRHCQKCGLKVLIDDSLMSVNPFYCQRCAAVAKAPADEAAAPAPAPSASAGVSAPAPLAAVPAKGSALKVVCPYCKATFSGRVPAKPAKGGCPVCHKDLILLPDGGIRPSQGFDLAAWQKEQAAKSAAPAVDAKAEPAVIQSRIEARGTRIVKAPPNIAVTAAAEKAKEEDDLAEPPPDLGGETMLDMGRSSGKAPPAKPPPSEIEEAFPADLGGETMLDMGRSSGAAKKPAPASEVEDAFPAALGGETMLDMGRGSGKPAASAPPPSEIEEAFPADLGGETMLDMGRGSGKAPPAKSPASEVDDAFPAALGGETMLDMGRGGQHSGPLVAPAETQEAFPIGMGTRETLLDMDGVVRQVAGGPPPPAPPRPPLPPPQIEEEEPPPPPPEPEPEPAPAPEKPIKVPPLPPPVIVSGGPPKGRKPAAYALLLVPLLAGVIVSFLTDNASIKDLLGRIDAVAVRGYFQLRQKVAGVAPPADLPRVTPSPTPTPSKTPTPSPTKTVTPSPTPTPTPTPSEDPLKERKELEAKMTDLYLKHKKLDRQANQLDKDPSPDQKVLIERLRNESAGLKKKFDELQRQYVELYGSKFSPENQ